MTTISATLLDEARDLLDDAVELRRGIHRHPEVGLDLPRTQETVVTALDGLGLDIREGEATSSVVAVLDGAHPGPTVLLRGDMDALPMPENTGLEYSSEVEGAMHACGHDSHTSMLATAARLLAAHREELHGRVLFMFQPGEEGYFGAKIMIEEGLLDGDSPPSAAFAIHVAANEPAGTIMTKGGPLAASADRLLVEVHGRGGHASAPHRALDPIPAACEMALALQTMVTRRVNVFDPAVVTIAHIQAGTTDNVIPESAMLEGTLRTLSDATRELATANIRQVVEGIGAAHGVRAQLTVDQGYPSTVNDDFMAQIAVEVARDVLGDDLVSWMDSPVMGAEDFSYVLQRVPGVMVRLGVAPPDLEEPASNHSNRMLLHEPAMANGIALHAAFAMRILDGGPLRIRPAS
jgi:amidohydrolase